MLDILLELPVELSIRILHYVDPKTIKCIVENIPEIKPLVMVMSRKSYIEKWLCDYGRNYYQKYIYTVQKKMIYSM